MRLSLPRALILAFPLAQAACVDNAVHESTVQKLEEARRSLAVRETEIKAYQWQLATVAQQIQESQARSDAREKELYAQLRDLAATTAALGERLKKVESEGAAMALASSAPAGDPGRDGRDVRPSLRPDELRRLFAAADARNALVLEQLARIERLLSGGPGGPGAPALPAANTVPRRPPLPGADVRDPWGFESRK
jgi:uncharacterized membrane protein YccC